MDGLLSQGRQQTAEGRLDDALGTLKQAVAQEPGSSVAHTRLGGVQLLRQEYQDGITSFQQAIMLDQKNADAFVGMALAYLHQGRFELAREALSEAGRLEPEKKPEIDKVLAWIDQRSTAAGH